jgi:hypothetical protein
MKSSTVPMICGTALAAMSAAGASHWWSVNQFVSAFPAGPPVSAPARLGSTPAVHHQPSTPAPAPLAQTPTRPASTPVPDPGQKAFYEALISKMEKLQNQNRDLLDQVAETNRDLMKLEFRVDTHSESFRPLPVNEEQIETTDNSLGVLPPRAEPVILLPNE